MHPHRHSDMRLCSCARLKAHRCLQVHMKASSMSLSCHVVGRPLHRVGHETVRVCGRLLGETCHHRLNPTSLSEATLVVVASCPSGAEFSTGLHVPVTSSWCWSVVPTGSVLSCRMWTGTWSLGHCVCTTHSMHGNHFVFCGPCAASFFLHGRPAGRPSHLFHEFTSCLMPFLLQAHMGIYSAFNTVTWLISKGADLHHFCHRGHRVVETTTEVCHNWAIRHVIFTTLEYHVFDNRTFDIVEWILWLPLHSAA